MTDFDPLAPGLDGDPLNLSHNDLVLIREVLATTSDIQVRAAHLYDRKGYANTDDFAGRPNPAYRGQHDDIVVQVSVVISRYSEPGPYAAMTGIYERVQDAKRQADVDARQAEVAAAQEALAQAQARLNELHTQP